MILFFRILINTITHNVFAFFHDVFFNKNLVNFIIYKSIYLYIYIKIFLYLIYYYKLLLFKLFI